MRRGIDKRNGNAFLSDRENEIERISKMHLEIEMKKAMNIVTREDMLYTSYAYDAAKARFALSCIDTIYTISSFTHEFGHLIDHQMGDLSEQAAFSSVIKKYREYLETQEKPELLSSKYNRYLLTPTEVFARSFELYVAKSMCITGCFSKSEFGNEYDVSDENVRMINTYFSKLFSDYNFRK